ncbi:hypothetical protein N0V88_007093 [Collariella sp. IMI 366227]|nr:hypothetical protein N0V88_007093 [Collariella sp. IMI 366227]
MADKTTDSTPIPGPPGYPLVGNALDFNTEFPLQTFQSYAEQYGEIYRLNMPKGQILIASSQALVHELCDETRFRKPIGSTLGEVRNGVHDGLFTAFGDEPNWGIAHRVLMPAFGPTSIQGMFDEMHEIAAQLALKWARHGPDMPIMVTDDFTRLTLDTLALCAMDFRFNSYYHDELHPFIQAMGDFLSESGARGMRPAVTSIFHHQATRKYWEDIQTLRKTAQGVLDARKAHPSNRRDLLTAMLDGKDPKTGQRLSDSSIIDNLITFLIAGHETTSGLLSFAFYLLIKHPEAYRKAQEEVDSLPYIAAILRETLRMCPTIPMIGRTANEDGLLGGKYPIAKDQNCFLLLAQSQIDPAVFGDTAKGFVPERMLDENFDRLSKEFPDFWKPFGTGVRACIGRPFAWQEAIIVMAVLLQNFDFVLDNPSYEFKIKQTLTTKPKDFYMRAVLRHEQTPTELEHRLSGGRTSRTNSKATATTTAGAKQGKPMSIFYGSNTGTCESLAQRLATDAASHGYAASITSLDAVTDNLPTDQPVAIITASYEGQPPDNAAPFYSWVNGLKADELKGVSYAVFGCGHHDWSQTFHKVPKHMDSVVEARGGSRLCELGLTDVAEGDMFTDFEQWEDDVFWPAIEAKYGVAEGADYSPSIDVQLTCPRSSTLRQDVREAVVVSERVLTAAGASPKKHIEIQLPEGMAYKVGDYLAVLPENPRQNVVRAMRQFHLSCDSHVTIGSDKSTALPTDVPVPVYTVLGSYVELSQPATKRGILKLADAAKDEATKQQLQTLAGNSYQPEISLKRVTILDLLERFSIPLPFGTFLSLLPPMRSRQYSISSSPTINPNHATLTYTLLSAPSLADPTRKHIGVGTSYLASLVAGDKLQVSVRPTHTAFRLPEDACTPIICVAAGSGLAPFRGFIQDRAAQLAKGAKLGPTIFFFGCRGPQLDDLYREEFDKWQEVGVVDVRRAFSRVEDPEDHGCKHVQDRLWNDREEVKGLWENGARVYVCGSRSLGDGVKGMLGKVILGDGATGEEITAWFDKVRNERYATDVFD